MLRRSRPVCDSASDADHRAVQRDMTTHDAGEERVHQGIKAEGSCMARHELLGGTSILLLWLGALGLVAASTPSGQPQAKLKGDFSQNLPPGAGKELVVAQCENCHGLERVVPLRKTEEGWKAILAKMLDEGAEFSPAEGTAIVRYLSDALGPDAPPLVDVNTATRADLMKLPGLTAAAADRLASRRTAKGLFASTEEVRATLELDDEAFDKLRWYVWAHGKTTPPR